MIGDVISITEMLYGICFTDRENRALSLDPEPPDPNPTLPATIRNINKSGPVFRLSSSLKQRSRHHATTADRLKLRQIKIIQQNMNT
ncbi:hypothetical protein HanPSC8_Chr13g0593581 [Helianthus annuus]|nr:hypothetical protein HanPSC8_Chr13g0593581 [Helianthus annuus]